MRYERCERFFRAVAYDLSEVIDTLGNAVSIAWKCSKISINAPVDAFQRVA